MTEKSSPNVNVLANFPTGPLAWRTCASTLWPSVDTRAYVCRPAFVSPTCSEIMLEPGCSEVIQASMQKAAGI
jgi:hypothetical protein